MKKIINCSLIFIVVLLLSSCRKNINDVEAPRSSAASTTKSSTLTTSGNLMWYKHNGYLDGTANWASTGAGTQVGSGWAQFKSVFATNNGVIYGITTDGKLLWYKHNGYLSGTASWANNGQAIQVGSGWAGFKSVFATDNGVIYGITTDGKLLWYKHNGYLSGTASWASTGAGTQVGSGWAQFKSVFATNNGVIYGITTDGKLLWYKHNGYLSGTASWASTGAGTQVGSGWAQFKSVFATNNGVIYGITTDGKLLWYKHNGYLSGTASWASTGAGTQVGSGWAQFKSVFATNNGVIYGIKP